MEAIRTEKKIAVKRGKETRKMNLKEGKWYWAQERVAEDSLETSVQLKHVHR